MRNVVVNFLENTCLNLGQDSLYYFIYSTFALIMEILISIFLSVFVSSIPNMQPRINDS